MPLVHLRLLLAVGGQHAPPSSPGLPSFAAALLDEGTADHTGPELATKIERLGGYLATGASWDASVVEAEVLPEDLGTGMELLAEVVRSPTFPEHEVARTRRQLQAEISRRRAQPAAVANEHFERCLYRGTVYDTPLIGTASSLEDMDRGRVAEFASQYLSPAGATLVAVGALEPQELAERAEAALGSWSGEPVAAPKIEVARLAGLHVEIVDRPGAAQTEIRVGHVGIHRAHPRYHEATILSSLLGGKFTSRLNLNLRERRGFTYGVRSAFGRRKGPAPFIVSTALATEHVGTAIDEIFAEIQRLLDEPPSEGEIADTKDYLIGSFPYSVETLSGLAARLSSLAVYELGDDYYEHWAEQILAVSGADLLETARELLTPEHSAIVCVGPAEELRPQLESRFDDAVSVHA